MAAGKGYRTEAFGKYRRIVAASLAVSRRKHTIHLFTEADVTHPRQLMKEYTESTGEKLSFTGYIVACIARVCSEMPAFNSFRKGNKWIFFDDVTVNVLYEREFEGERVPESVAVQWANRKSSVEISREIRHEKNQPGKHMGDSSGMGWIRFIPGFLLRAFIRWASGSIRMQKKYGVVGVTAIGMFGSAPVWAVPITNATVTVAVGSIIPRVVMVDGRPEERDHVCLTLSFDHDLIDGAPATRFTHRLVELIRTGEGLAEP